MQTEMAGLSAFSVVLVDTGVDGLGGVATPGLLVNGQGSL